ncbi:MAG: DUF6497 family protein [Pseudomonadota bacterium]
MTNSVGLRARSARIEGKAGSDVPPLQATVAILRHLNDHAFGFARHLRVESCAAPSGRTLFSTGGRGCLISFFAIVVLCAVAVPSSAAAFEVPSGQPLDFQESFYERRDDGTLAARFRFIMPAIAEEVGYVDVADDFLALCERYALPSLADRDMPDEIVISIADRSTEFGVTAKDATQFFEAFRPDGASCIWDGF